MLFHFITFKEGGEELFKNDQLHRIANYGSQGVELFYIISGFVIYHSLKSREYVLGMYPVYLKKRFLRIFPPFLGVIALIALTPLLWNSPYPYSFEQLLQNASLVVDLFGNVEWLNPIFATLKVEFLFYFLIGFLVVFMRKNEWLYCLVVAISLIAILLFPTIEIVHNAPFFLVGIALSEISSREKVVLNYAIIAACILIVGILFPVEDLVVTVLALIFLVWVKIKNTFLEKIGQFSYSLYLVHGLSGGLCIYVLRKQTFVVLNPWLTLVIALSVAIGFAYAYYRIVEKKSIQWSKKVNY